VRERRNPFILKNISSVCISKLIKTVATEGDVQAICAMRLCSKRPRSASSELSVSLWLAWMTLVACSGLFLFTAGFFLTRFEIHERAECAYDSGHQKILPSSDTPSAPSVCGEPIYDRVMMLVIDALRFDMVAYDPHLPHDETPSYRNKMPITHQLLHWRPSQSMLYKFRADPPTTTTQRLKGRNSCSPGLTCDWFGFARLPSWQGSQRVAFRLSPISAPASPVRLCRRIPLWTSLPAPPAGASG